MSSSLPDDGTSSRPAGDACKRDGLPPQSLQECRKDMHPEYSKFSSSSGDLPPPPPDARLLVERHEFSRTLNKNVPPHQTAAIATYRREQLHEKRACAPGRAPNLRNWDRGLELPGTRGKPCWDWSSDSASASGAVEAPRRPIARTGAVRDNNRSRHQLPDSPEHQKHIIWGSIKGSSRRSRGRAGPQSLSEGHVVWGSIEAPGCSSHSDSSDSEGSESSSDSDSPPQPAGESWLTSNGRSTGSRFPLGRPCSNNQGSLASAMENGCQRAPRLDSLHRHTVSRRTPPWARRRASRGTISNGFRDVQENSDDQIVFRDSDSGSSLSAVRELTDEDKSRGASARRRSDSPGVCSAKDHKKSQS